MTLEFSALIIRLLREALAIQFTKTNSGSLQRKFRKV